MEDQDNRNPEVKDDERTEPNANETQNYRNYGLGMKLVKLGFLFLAVLIVFVYFFIFEPYELVLLVLSFLFAISMVFLGFKKLKEYQQEKQAYKKFIKEKKECRKEKRIDNREKKEETARKLSFGERSITFKRLDEGAKLDYHSRIFLRKFIKTLKSFYSKTCSLNLSKLNDDSFPKPKKQNQSYPEYIYCINEFLKINSIKLFAEKSDDFRYTGKIIITYTKNNVVVETRFRTKIDYLTFVSLFEYSSNVEFR